MEYFCSLCSLDEESKTLYSICKIQPQPLLGDHKLNKFESTLIENATTTVHILV